MKTDCHFICTYILCSVLQESRQDGWRSLSWLLGHLEVVAADKWDKEGLDVSLLLLLVRSSLLGVRRQSSPQSLQISGQIVK